jgi:hypothetical protein
MTGKGKQDSTGYVYLILMGMVGTENVSSLKAGSH